MWSAPDRGRANQTEKKMAKKKIETGLFADQRGRITCKEHAPLEGSDTWVFDQWKALTAAEARAFEKEIGRAPACETCTPSSTPTSTETTSTLAETTPAADAAPTAAPAKPSKSKKSKSTATLEQACEGYLRHLEESGKSQGTLFSYKLELVVAMEELGAKTCSPRSPSIASSPSSARTA